MRVFFNFFIKTLAFLTAMVVFFTILSFLISILFQNFKEVKKNHNFEFIEGNNNSQNKIIFIELRGPIFEEPSDLIEFNLIENFEIIYVSEFKNNLEEIEFEKPKGIVISINSPGGSVSATYNLYKTIKEFKIKNNIKIFIHTNELLASGGYWAALAGDKIYSSYGAMIGSIGVRGPDWIYFDKPVSISTGIFGQTVKTKDGIKKFNTFAGRSKDLFDPFREPTKEEIDSLQDIVDGIYNDFINDVSNQRHIETSFIVHNLGALLFDAKKAKENYLIDDITNLSEVIIQIAKELKLKDYKVIEKKRKKGFFQSIIKSSLIMRYDINSLIETRVCGLTNNYINVILANKQYTNNC
tara:strand:- start:133 stop:1194 length:1062 start_codon:yes stop_codon:yes gene_type:complete